jgi:hypothetical protein
MAKPQGRKDRRQVSDEAVIDHLAKEVKEERSSGDGHTVRSPTTGDGTPVEEQVRKERDPRKSGLPTF